MQNGISAEDVNKSSFERPLAAPSEVMQSPSLPASAEINDNTQLLRLETINATESRRIMLFIKVTIALALIGAVLLAAIKESPRGIDMIVLNRNFVIMQVVTFAILLGSLLLMFAVWGTAVARSFHNKMVWSPRRLRDVQATLLCACAATVIMSGQFANNVRLLTDPSTFCYSKEFTAAIGFLIFTGFDTLLLLLVIKAHGTNLTSGKDHTHSTVRDAPWASHWPKVVFIWLPYLGVVMWIVLMIAEDGHSVEVAVAGGGACGWGADVVCSTSAAFNISGVLSVIAIVAYFALYIFYLVRAWRQLSTKLYQKFRLQNIVLLIQLRVNAAMVGTLLVSMALTWYLSQNPCVNYAVTWFGVPSVGLTVVSIQAVAFYTTYPRSRRAVAAHEAAPTYLLQQFAWTEPEVPRKLAARAAAIRGSPAAAVVTAAPLFCFETAIKLFFWSVLVYSYTEADPSDIRKVPDAIRKLIGGMEAAMRMFDLSKRRMFYDRACGTKVLVTWNAATILVVVRGTAEAANFLQDAKFLQTAHPPVRKFKGRTPCVHTGFLATWQSNGIRARILEHVSTLLDSAEDRNAVRVLCTGHSLGGAVAQLASIDIARELGVGPRNIKVYTYGCPRLGNHALAEEVDEVVPDTWHIINDNDIVTRGMKLLGLYKRAGQRVIVNSQGHLIVRPSHLETSLLQRMRGAKGAHHMTVEYQRSLVAIVTAQLQASSRHGDGLHGLLGLLKGVPQVRLVLESHAASMGTSLVDLVPGLGHDAHPGSPSAPGNALGSPNFSMRHQKSLMRVVAGQAADDAGLAATHGSGSSPGSPAPLRRGQAPHVFEVGGEDADEVTADAVAAGPGDAPPVQDDVNEAAAAGMSRWRGAAAVARLAVGLARSAAAAPPANLGAHADLSAKRSGSVAETGVSEDALDGAPHALVTCTVVGGGAGGDGTGEQSASAWLAPLGLGAEARQAGACMHGDVIEIGAAPDMRGLQGCPRMATSAVQSQVGGDAMPCPSMAGLGVAGSATATSSCRERCCLAADDDSMHLTSACAWSCREVALGAPD